jgi:toxin ParE1/3/4
MGYRLTSEAEADIIGIAKMGLRQFGERQADRYNNELFALFDLIAANPRMARERSEVSPPVRVFPFKVHLVVYLVDGNDDVLIVRVRHGHENWIDD